MQNIELLFARVINKLSELDEKTNSLSDKVISKITRKNTDLILYQGNEKKVFKDAFKRGLDGNDGDSIKGDEGKSAYDIWLEVGNKGTKEDFINSLKGRDGETITNKIEVIKEKPIVKNNIVKEVVKQEAVNGKDGVGIKSVELNKLGELIIIYTNGKESNLGKIIFERLVRMVGGAGGGGASSINELKDVNITNPQEGDQLIFQNGKWVNESPLKSPTTVIDDYEIQVGDGAILVNATKEVDITLYTAVDNEGRSQKIKNIGTANVNVKTVNNELVEKVNCIIITKGQAGAYISYEFESNGEAWFIV